VPASLRQIHRWRIATVIDFSVSEAGRLWRLEANGVGVDGILAGVPL